MCSENIKKIVLSILLIFVMNLHAQESKLKKGVLERMVQPKISLDSSYLSSADVSGSEGSVGVAKNSVKINNAFAEVSYSNWSFAWDDIDRLPFGNGVDDPIKQMHSVKVGVKIPFPISDKWFLLTSLSVNSTFEKEMDDSYGAGVFGFASYRLDQDHSIQMGAFANYHPISTLVLPVMSYSYRARQRDGFQLVLGFPRAYVGYYVSDKMLLRSGMIFSQSVIRLSDSSVVESGGYIEAKDYMGNMGVSYEFSSKFTLDVNFLYSLKRDFIIYNSAGAEESKYSIDPSMGVNLRLKYLF